MSNYAWDGLKVRLRPVLPSEEETRQWAERQALNTSNGDNVFLAIETFDETLIGSISTNSCNSRNGTFKYGVSIFRDHWRNGYASDAIKVVLRYYFKELRYRKVNAHVYGFNDGSLALQEHLGFI